LIASLGFAEAAQEASPATYALHSPLTHVRTIVYVWHGPVWF
jgi:hypothetical protein